MAKLWNKSDTKLDPQQLLGVEQALQSKRQAVMSAIAANGAR